jgi:hypothetical protein
MAYRNSFIAIGCNGVGQLPRLFFCILFDGFVMAHPYHHSLSSVRSFGGNVSDFIKIHSWFDETKAHFADFRHRSFRHHKEGVAIMSEVFGPTLMTSCGGVVPTSKIGEQHITEDCLSVVSSSDWANSIKFQKWMGTSGNRPYRPERTWGGESEDYSFILDFFNRGDRYVHNHSAGCFTLESLQGEWFTNSAGKAVPLRAACEVFLKSRYGAIPSPSDWAKHIRPAAWMVKTQKIEANLLAA